MVNEYLNEKCQYDVGQLKPFIYLLDKDVLINYTVDNGVAIVHDTTGGTIYKVNGNTASLSSEETLEGRFKFLNKVTLTIQETKEEGCNELINKLIRNEYKVVVEDRRGTQYIANLDFYAMITYNYQFQSNISPNLCTITFNCDSNFPTLMIETNITEDEELKSTPCEYHASFTKELRLCEKDYSYIVRDETTFSKVYVTTADASLSYKRIKFIPQSFTFTEDYDGNNFTHTLKFSIPLSDYKSYWQYNLIEFKENRYVALFETANGNVIASGFDNGYFPSYLISSSDNINSPNTIQITLTHVAEEGFCYNNSETLSGLIGEDYKRFYSDVKPFYGGDQYFDTSVCVNNTTRAYTLLQEVTATGAKLPRYIVLQGHENDFDDADINIVGSYKLTDTLGVHLTYDTNVCGSGDISNTKCAFQSTPDKIYHLNNSEKSASAIISSDCTWVIQDIPNWLTFNRTSGNAATSYNVSFEVNTNVPVATSTATIHIVSEDNVYTFNVIYSPTRGSEDENGCDWFTPSTVNLTAKSQTVTFYVAPEWRDIIDARNITVGNNPDNLSVRKINNYTFNISVPENNSITSKTYTINILPGYNDYNCPIQITQDKKYFKEVPQSNTICIGNDEYQQVARYYGYYADQVNIFDSYITGNLIQSNSPNCMSNIQYIWIVVESEYVCINNNKYQKLKQQVSYDNGTTWSDTGTTKAGTLIELNSNDCKNIQPGETIEKWEAITGYMCDGYDSYTVEAKYISTDSGQTWTDTGETRKKELIKTNDERCGYVPQEYQYDWDPVVGEYICSMQSDGSYCKYFKLEKVRSLDGIHWEAVNPPIYQQGDEIACGLSQCHTDRYDEPSCIQQQRWMSVPGEYECVNNNKYYKMQLQLSDDCAITWYDANPPVYQAGDLIEANSGDCAPVYTYQYYQWETVPNDFECDGTSKYAKEVYKGSVDGNVWEIVQPPQYRRGQLIETNSEDCGYHTPQYRWVTVSGDYICDGYDKYAKEKQQVSNDGGVTWSDVSPANYRKGSLIQTNSTDCGYIPPTVITWEEVPDHYICEEVTPAYTKWEDVPGQYVCDGVNKYHKQIKMVSFDGTNWTAAVPPEYQQGSLIEYNSTDCGYVPPVEPVYQWIDTDEYICDGYNKYVKEKQQVSMDNGETWSDTGETRTGSLIEENSPDCGYVIQPQYRWDVVTDEYICDEGNNEMSTWSVMPDDFVCE